MRAERKNAATLPFWQVFPSFFLYPFRLQPFLRIAFLALLAGLAGILPALFAWLAWLGWFIGIVRYCFFVLQDTAHGYIDDDNDKLGVVRDAYLPYKQFAVFLIMLVIVGQIGQYLGSHVAQLALILVCVMLPAQSMLLALTGDMGQSLTPARIWFVIRTMGFPYLGLCGTLFLLFSSQGIALAQLVKIFPASLLPVMLGSVGGYFFVVMFRLMGYMLYQQHRHLNFDVDNPLPETHEASGLENMAALIKSGQFDLAIQQLQDAISRAPDRISSHLDLHRLLLGLPDRQPEMLVHAKEGLALALNGRDHEPAMVFLQAISQHQPDFKPADAATCLKLARWCLQSRRYNLGLQLLKGFDRQPGVKNLVPDAYLLGAKLLIDARQDEGQARKILLALKANYPTHSTAVEAERLLTMLDRLQASPAG